MLKKFLYSTKFLEDLDDRQNLVASGKDVPPASFKDIFGDMSDNIFDGDLDLSGISLRDLKGMPRSQEPLHIYLDNNPDLEFYPPLRENVYTGSSIFIDEELFHTISEAERNHYRTIYRVYRDLDSFNYKNALFDSVTSFNLVSFFDKNYSSLVSEIDIQKYSEIYTKLNNDRDKLEKVFELL